MRSRAHSGMTLEQVAEELGISKRRVLQIEKSAIAKLRRLMNSDYAGRIGPFLLDHCGVPDPDHARDAVKRRQRIRRRRSESYPP